MTEISLTITDGKLEGHTEPFTLAITYTGPLGNISTFPKAIQDLSVLLGLGGDDAPAEVSCRVCGCTNDNACADEDGNGCSWAEPDLCSECVGKEDVSSKIEGGGDAEEEAEEEQEVDPEPEPEEEYSDEELMEKFEVLEHFDISEPTLYSYMKKDKIPTPKVQRGKKKVWIRAEIEATELKKPKKAAKPDESEEENEVEELELE